MFVDTSLSLMLQPILLVNGSNLLFAGRRVNPLSDVVDIPSEQLVRMTLQQLSEGSRAIEYTQPQSLYHCHGCYIYKNRISCIVLVFWIDLYLRPALMCKSLCFLFFLSESICWHVEVHTSQSTCTHSMHTSCVG